MTFPSMRICEVCGDLTEDWIESQRGSEKARVTCRKEECRKYHEREVIL